MKEKDDGSRSSCSLCVDVKYHIIKIVIKIAEYFLYLFKIPAFAAKYFDSSNT
jgi:hypothetical protein